MTVKNKLIQGFGINDFEGSISVNGTILKSYNAWTAMLSRCYSDAYQARYPTYKGCSVSEDWKHFTNFKEWYEENYVEGFQLDKDILVPGNKIYSAETCIFVSPQLNKLLTHKQSNQGHYPTGVCYNKRDDKFQAEIGLKGKSKKLGYFDTVEQAESAYLTAKANEVIRQSLLPTTPDKAKASLVEMANEMLEKSFVLANG